MDNINIEALRACYTNPPLSPHAPCNVCGRGFKPEDDQARTCSQACARLESMRLLVGERVSNYHVTTRRCVRCGEDFEQSREETLCRPCKRGSASRHSLAYDDDSASIYSIESEDTRSATPPPGGHRLLRHDKPLPTPPPRHSDKPPLSAHKSVVDLRRAHSHPARPHSPLRRSSTDTQEEPQPPATPPKPSRSLPPRPAPDSDVPPPVPPRPKGGHRPPHVSAPVPEKDTTTWTAAPTLRRAVTYREPGSNDVQRVYIPPPRTHSTASFTKRLPSLPGSATHTLDEDRTSSASLTRRKVAFGQDFEWYHPPAERHVPQRSNTLPLRSAMKRDTHPRPSSGPTTTPTHDAPDSASIVRVSSPLGRTTVRASELGVEQPVASGSRSRFDMSKVDELGFGRRHEIHWYPSQDVPESAAPSPSPSPPLLDLAEDTSQPGTPRAAYGYPQRSPPVDVPVFLDDGLDSLGMTCPPEGVDLLPPIRASQALTFTPQGGWSSVLNRPLDSRRSSMYSTKSVNVAVLKAPLLKREVDFEALSRASMSFHQPDVVPPSPFRTEADGMAWNAVRALRADIEDDQAYSPRFTYHSEM